MRSLGRLRRSEASDRVTVERMQGHLWNASAAQGGEGECDMRILRSMAVWITAIGLLGSAAAMQAQDAGTGQHNGGMPGNGGMSQGGQSQSGQPGMVQVRSASQSDASSPGMPQPSMPSIGGTSLEDASNGRNPRTDEEMEKLRSNERQKKLVADTDRLLSLANELKTDMDKTSKDTLSLDVVRKADEIEKLAHSVKERMKGA